VTRAFKLGVVATHPVQYLAPLYRELARRPEIQLEVHYFTDCAQAPTLDSAFGVSYAWDVDLTSGYSYGYLDNRARRPSPRFWGSNCPELRPMLRARRHDGLLLPGYKCRGYLQAQQAAVRSSVPVLFRGESTDHIPRSALKTAARDAFLRRFFAGISAFLPIGAHAARHFRRLGVAESALFSSPYGVDNERFLTASRELIPHRERVRHGFGLPANAFVAVVPGKLIARKRPVDALHGAAASGAGNLWLLFAGDGPLRGELARAAHDTGFARFAVTGFLNQTEIVKAYCAADVLVLPSHHETWGVVVNEGMACGLPAVITDGVGCAPDLVETGKTGFVCPVADVERLSRILHDLAEHPDVTARMGGAARARVCEGFSAATAADGVVRACEYVASTSRNG
jgi:glycosyltransferase involved in cell wall biosynthesis